MKPSGAASPAGAPVPEPKSGIPVQRRGRRRWWGGAALVATAGALAVWWCVRTPEAPSGDPFPLAPITSSPFQNTRAAAHYVGSDACLPCHGGRHTSFRHTGMGRSMAAVDVRHEPPDGAFDHAASKRRYQVVRKDGTLWHRELLLAAGAADVVLSEYPVQYVIGSGRHARTYLVEADGFLVESPVTWYPSRGTWGVSPGYDKPNQQGFGRPVGEGCLYCHVGKAEVLGRSLHRIHITETAIGCERCHGPGSLHVERHHGPPGDGAAADMDDSIVNPSHLSRELAEAVCQQCHINSVAIVANRGRKLTDFRPGLPWQDFVQVYVPAADDGSMTVVGHVEQMHASRCYQRSKTLTCLTCHDPHNEPAPAERAAHYRAVCGKCHAPEHCTVDPNRRARESPGNDCVQCHMPRSDTDIPHLAFSHHRIGIHDRPPKAATRAGPDAVELRPFFDESPLGPVDRKLSLGEAYRQAALRETDAARAGQYRRRALELLSEVHEAGLRDPDLDAGLAQLCFDMGVGEALPYAESALGSPGLTGQSRAYVLFVFAQVNAGRGNHAAAVTALRELTGLRRLASDWLLMANFSRASGNDAAAIDALTTAVRIDPRLVSVHRYLAEYFRKEGDAGRAAWHQQRAVP
jgi:hypothetical protein